MADTLAALLRPPIDSGGQDGRRTALLEPGRCPRAIPYTELHAVAEGVQVQLGHVDGYAAESPLALLATHSTETVCLLLAAARAGVPLAPLNPAISNPDDLEFLLNDVGAGMLLVRGRWGAPRGQNGCCGLRCAWVPPAPAGG